MDIYFATGNANKVKEVSLVLPEIKIIDLDLPEIQSLDPDEVITAKLTAAHKLEPTKNIAVEDVSYSITGLGGLPGTLYKWFEQTVGEQGVFDMIGDKDPTTVAMASVGMVRPSGEMVFVRGEAKGRTVSPVKGSSFGFAQIFIPDGYDVRWSEMDKEQLAGMTHRERAWQALKGALQAESN